MKTRWLIGAATLIIGIVCLVLWMPIASSPPAPGVTLENAKRIHAAMTVEDVALLMGSEGMTFDFKGRTKFDGNGAVEWCTEKEAVQVRFHADFANKVFFDNGGPEIILELDEETLPVKLRRWWRRNVW